MKGRRYANHVLKEFSKRAIPKYIRGEKDHNCPLSKVPTEEIIQEIDQEIIDLEILLTGTRKKTSFVFIVVFQKKWFINLLKEKCVVD